MPFAEWKSGWQRSKMHSRAAWRAPNPAWWLSSDLGEHRRRRRRQQTGGSLLASKPGSILASAEVEQGPDILQGFDASLDMYVSRAAPPNSWFGSLIRQFAIASLQRTRSALYMPIKYEIRSMCSSLSRAGSSRFVPSSMPSSNEDSSPGACQISMPGGKTSMQPDRGGAAPLGRQGRTQ
jgi:hypothetical protein